MARRYQARNMIVLCSERAVAREDSEAKIRHAVCKALAKTLSPPEAAFLDGWLDCLRFHRGQASMYPAPLEVTGRKRRSSSEIV